eukprot:m.55163 g.55163  ORF g.55163 m.55163 type:complete len:346 (+) comp11470_c0_seq3:218-1255(+)
MPRQATCIACCSLQCCPTAQVKLISSTLPEQQLINTGNILRCDHRQTALAKGVPSTEEEMLLALQCTHNCWRCRASESTTQSAGRVVCLVRSNKKQGFFSFFFFFSFAFFAFLSHHTVLQPTCILSVGFHFVQTVDHPQIMQQVPSAALHETSITAKLFVMCEYTPGDAVDAAIAAARVLDVPALTQITISSASPPTMLEQDQALADLRTLKSSGVVEEFGVCDVTPQQLQCLVDQSDATGTARPSFVQVHSSLGETMDAEALLSLSAQHNVAVMAHDDAPITNVAEITNSVHKFWLPFHADDEEEPPLPTLQWMLRYTVVDTARSVVEMVGYVASSVPQRPKLS